MTTQYSVVRFSPIPEQTEFVNVALLFSDRRWGLIYDDSFPKLTCIAPHVDTLFLVRYLKSVVASAAEANFATTAGEVGRASSQFEIGPTRELTQPVTAELVAQLRKTYLSKAHHTHRKETMIERRRIEHQLENFLGRFLPADRPSIKSKAKPNQYLSEEVVRRLRDTKFHVARIVSTPKHLIALDGVDLSWKPDVVERRAYQVSFAYDMLVGVAEPIRRFENRDVYRAALVFGRPDSAKHEHAIDMLSKYASAVVRRGDGEDAVPIELEQRLRAAAEVLPEITV